MAEIREDGVVDEHYCFLELVSDQGIYIWTNPAGVESTADTAVRLEERDGMYVRPLDQHSALFSWSASAQPEDCVAGELHETGCLCAADQGLPTDPNDCRVIDAEGDEIPGGNLYLDVEPAEDPGANTGFLSLSVVASLGLEWRLPLEPGERLVGEVEGGLEQSELSRPAEFEEDLGPVLNAMCPGELGHVELVKGEFDCAAIMAGRAVDLAGHDIFNVALDGQPPELDACPDPACLADGDGDGTPDCEDECPDDVDKAEPGQCGCGEVDEDSDGDGRADCEDLCPNDPDKFAPGECECGTPDTDADDDGKPHCIDECENDINKTTPGICGCGTPDTDDDKDGTPACQDECDNDEKKVEPGECGCGATDVDSDGDLVFDCKDACPDDAKKSTVGVCGCGMLDVDSDDDQVFDCEDACPGDPLKFESEGACGCGVADTDSDGDSTPDCQDGCPSDRNKKSEGLCGCGVADTDSDGDRTPDCTDGCPQDPNKKSVGLCGCGTADTDSDSDGTPNCQDGCPSDPNKTAAGACGCGTADTDSDGDRTPDCDDRCPADPEKRTEGTCGCGIPDRDLDGNGSIDCSDLCPQDPNKVAPGICGCGVPDVNSDGDTALDCKEECDTDPNKLAPGQCGCGRPDTDSDGDRTADCVDLCPSDAGKTTPGVCDCGTPDVDSDGDGVMDCNDACSGDPDKVVEGLCGCNVPETDTDRDGTPNCIDACPSDSEKTQAGVCGCGEPDTDTDGDGTFDCDDGCPTDRGKTAPGVCGCGTADTDRDSDRTPDCQDQCPNNPNLVAPGRCGCDGCPSLQGTYAMRTSVYNKSVVDGAVSTQKSLGYNLVTFTPNQDGTTRMTLQTCWAQSVPSPDANPAAYTWSRSSVLQAVPPSTATLTPNPDGSLVRAAPPAPVSIGWDAARQPAVCTAAATPVAPWPASWGATCTCNDTAFPPFDSGGQPYDCRVTDVDNDGLPGLTAYASTVQPADPDATAPLFGAAVYGVSDLQDRLVIRPGEPGEVLWGNIEELHSMAGVVGCRGLACSALGDEAPVGAACPPALNRAQFVPVTPSFDTCQEIVAGRMTIFDTNQDGPWPDDSACPPPR